LTAEQIVSANSIIIQKLNLAGRNNFSVIELQKRYRSGTAIKEKEY